MNVKEWCAQEQGKHFCHCGCGGVIKIIPLHHKPCRGIPCFIKGHNPSPAKFGVENHRFGTKHSDETIKKMSDCKQRDKHPMHGRHHTEEAKKRIGEAAKILTGIKNHMYGKTGEKHHGWKGGLKAQYRRGNVTRRLLLEHNPIELNKDFKGSEGHHIDKKFIINIPKELHKSIYHRQKDSCGMKEINKEAFKYLYEHKEDLIMNEQEVFNINLGVG